MEYSFKFGIGVFIECTNKLTLILRDNKEKIANPGTLALVGGALNKKEHYLHAAKRELFEELQIKLIGEDVKRLHHIGMEYYTASSELILVNGLYQLSISETEYERIILREGKSHALYTFEEIYTMREKLGGAISRFMHDADGVVKRIINGERVGYYQFVR